MANTAADVLIESLKNGGGGIKADVVLPSSKGFHNAVEKHPSTIASGDSAPFSFKKVLKQVFLKDQVIEEAKNLTDPIRPLPILSRKKRLVGSNQDEVVCGLVTCWWRGPTPHSSYASLGDLVVHAGQNELFGETLEKFES